FPDTVHTLALEGNACCVVTRGDAKIDYRRGGRARERGNLKSPHLPSPIRSSPLRQGRTLVFVVGLFHVIPTQSLVDAKTHHHSRRRLNTRRISKPGFLVSAATIGTRAGTCEGRIGARKRNLAPVPRFGPTQPGGGAFSRGSRR